jgi:hypothetical protein
MTTPLNPRAMLEQAAGSEAARRNVQALLASRYRR